MNIQRAQQVTAAQSIILIDQHSVKKKLSKQELKSQELQKPKFDKFFC